MTRELPMAGDENEWVRVPRAALEDLKRHGAFDNVYDVRERCDLSVLKPGESSWDHPDVKSYSDACEVIEKALAAPAHGDGEGVRGEATGDTPTFLETWMKLTTRDRAIISAYFRETTTRPTPEAQEARDAARYRWLRDPENAIVYAKDLANWNGVPYSKPYGHFSYATPEQLDTAIDAALALPAQGEGNNG